MLTYLFWHTDFGPKTATPLICLPGIAGLAAVFFRLIEQLAAKGHRVISVRKKRATDLVPGASGVLKKIRAHL